MISRTGRLPRLTMRRLRRSTELRRCLAKCTKFWTPMPSLQKPFRSTLAGRAHAEISSTKPSCLITDQILRHAEHWSFTMKIGSGPREIFGTGEKLTSPSFDIWVLRHRSSGDISVYAAVMCSHVWHRDALASCWLSAIEHFEQQTSQLQ